MLVQKYIREFNDLSKDVNFLSVADEVNLTNKLKLIQTQFIDEEVAQTDIESFFTNLYHLLCQSNNIKSSLLESCVDILSSSINSQNQKVRNSILSDCRFLSVLVSNVFIVERERELVKILQVIRDLISFGNEFDDHNLRLIVELLCNHTENTQNKDVRSLCMEILVNLCLNNDLARYIISRFFLASSVRGTIKSIDDDILAFKFVILIEDELTSKDLKYFIDLSFSSIAKTENFDCLQIKQSIDVLRHYKKHGVSYNTTVSEDEMATKNLKTLLDFLLRELQSPEISQEKLSFFKNIFRFFDMLIELNKRIVEKFENFVSVACITAEISKSKEALLFLATFLQNGGMLESPELVVESLVHFFVEDVKSAQQVCEQNFAFLTLVGPLEERDLLSDQQLREIEIYFDGIIGDLERADISKMEDDEVTQMIYFLYALKCIAKNKPAFLVKLNKVLQMDSVPLVYSRAHHSSNEELIGMLLQLSGISNFPVKAVAKIISEDNTRKGRPPKSVPANNTSLRRQENFNSVSARYMNRKLSLSLETTIERVNQMLDDNEPMASTDLIQIFSQKIRGLNDQLQSVTANLDKVTKELAEKEQRILSFRNISEKQEFKLWCIQLDKDRMCKEVTVVKKHNAELKKSVSSFMATITKNGIENKTILESKAKEIERKLQR